ncbi:hypothetical protein DPQ33_09835 [Oceanidesulfovibrio indonesiensis]|uniref:Tyr recombinase domain-containing protein n=1 Tax=Oceanidesulfovibrio indonesiensis TaxID=54767 RepID=A0A7M3ME68_9BACT|nr:tyrosine-type recombinase/integrase [Oceanidesulfovibrio indonesiensis]TVM17091.1 hypothetical protein DPQ33_09835 [Oceanidesulfovibrio indonesiensis]
MQQLTDEKIRELVDEWIKDALDAEYEALLRSGPWNEEKLGTYKGTLQLVGSEIYDAWLRKDFRQVKGRVDALLAHKGVEADRDSMVYRKLCDALLKAEADVLREVSDYTWEGPSSFPPTTNEIPDAQPQPIQQDEVKTGPTLHEAVEKYIEDKNPGWSPKSRIDMPPKLRQFVKIVGYDLPFTQLDRDAMRKYRDMMENLPARYEQKKIYRDKSFEEILAMDIPDEEKLAAKSLENRFIIIRSFLNWCEDEGYIEKVRGLNKVLKVSKATQGRSTGKRAPFTEDDLRNLFAPEAYAEETRKSPARFWMPLLALYTGARIEELAQLHLSDIKSIDGVLVIDINALDGKQLKTAAAVRRVPIHPFLGKLGFLDYVATMNKRGEQRLFPDLSLVEKTGKYSAAISQWFTRYRREQGVQDQDEEGRSRTFHSFRHTFITRSKHLGLNRNMLKEIVGHEQGETDDVTAIYEGSYPPRMLRDEFIKKIDFHERVEELNLL